MTKFELANLVIALLALVGTIWNTFTSSRNGKLQNELQEKQNELQERLLSLEDARERDRQATSRSAKLHAWIEPGRNCRLIIRNDGGCEARSVRTSIDGQPVLSHHLVPRGSAEVTMVGAGPSISYLLAVASGAGPLISVSLSWEDDSGKSGQWSSQLNLF